MGGEQISTPNGRLENTSQSQSCQQRMESTHDHSDAVCSSLLMKQQLRKVRKQLLSWPSLKSQPWCHQPSVSHTSIQVGNLHPYVQLENFQLIHFQSLSWAQDAWPRPPGNLGKPPLRGAFLSPASLRVTGDLFCARAAVASGVSPPNLTIFVFVCSLHNPKKSGVAENERE